jgi:hypothetical protein
MRFNKFTKYIPIKEDEYHEFKQRQRKEMKHTQEELALPNALQPLVAAQNEKTHTLLEPSADPETQEQRFAHLTSIINRLKRKVDEQQHKSVQVLPSTPLVGQTLTKMGQREQALANALGASVWNEHGQLIINGAAIPNSDKNELLNYAASNWTTKYLQKIPEGATQFQKLMRQQNIPKKMWAAKLRGAAPGAEEEVASSSIPEGFGMKTPTTQKKKKKGNPSTPGFDGATYQGLKLLNSGQKFNKFMKQSV